MLKYFFSIVPRIVIVYYGMKVLITAYSENGMPFVALLDPHYLPDLNKSEVQLVDEV